MGVEGYEDRWLPKLVLASAALSESVNTSQHPRSRAAALSQPSPNQPQPAPTSPNQPQPATATKPCRLTPEVLPAVGHQGRTKAASRKGWQPQGQIGTTVGPAAAGCESRGHTHAPQDPMQTGTNSGGALPAGGVDGASIQRDQHSVALQVGGAGAEWKGAVGAAHVWSCCRLKLEGDLGCAGTLHHPRMHPPLTRNTAKPMAMGARPLVEGGELLSTAVMCTT